MAHNSATHPFTISIAPMMVSRGGWDTEVLEISELEQLLGEHSETGGDANVPAWMPGWLQGDRRLNDEVLGLSAAVLNCNRGQPTEEITSRIDAAGHRAIIYSTYTHLDTRTPVRVNALKTAFGPEVATTPDVVRQFLVDVKGYRAEIADGVEIEQWGEGEFFAVHAPLPSCNVVLPLAEPFTRDSHGAHFGRDWKDLLKRLAADLGLLWNPSCVALSQGFVLPVCPPGKDRFAASIPGDLMTMDRILGR